MNFTRCMNCVFLCPCRSFSHDVFLAFCFFESDSYMIKSGRAADEYIDSAVRHVMMRQGVVGIKVDIMLPHDPEGKMGPKTPLSDIIKIFEPKDE